MMMRGALVVGLILSAATLPSFADEPQAGTEWPGPYRRLADLLDLQKAAGVIGVSYYTPVQDHRAIDVTTVDFSQGWWIWHAFELQARASMFHAHGNRTDAPNGVDPDSTATGIAVGPAARFYVLDLLGTFRRVRPFLEGSAQFLFTPGTRNGFPAGGSGVNGFERAGAGLAIQLGPRVAIEASYQWWSHVSDGTGVVPQNPMWNGHGGTIAIRRIF